MQWDLIKVGSNLAKNKSRNMISLKWLGKFNFHSFVAEIFEKKILSKSVRDPINRLVVRFTLELYFSNCEAMTNYTGDDSPASN